MQAFWRSFVFLFLAEMGDKTQVVSFAFGTEYGLVTVLLGVFVAVASLMAVTVAVGTQTASLLPTFWINIVSGLLFIAFGVWALKKHEAADGEKKVGEKYGAFIAVVVTFFLAELGDKTVLASMAMGSQLHQYFPVWLGSTLGMYLADVIAIVCGRILGKQLPDKVIRYGSALIFTGAGVYTLVEAFIHK
jgi:putative Ca2+/H+ antiporter (TMEM165/GDT1 family)